MKILEPVPCRAEFFKYIMWHNHASEVTTDLEIDVLAVHYDEYSTTFDSTKKRLLDFLGMKQTSSPSSFVSGKNYDSHFTTEEREAVKKVFDILASEQSRSEIERYF